MADQLLPAQDLKVAVVGKGASEVAAALDIAPAALEESDTALFIVSAVDGIVRADSDLWALARELYIPSLVLISDLSQENETDFEDMSAIAGRLLDPVVTPYLVLHNDDGAPVALIDLATMQIRDYSTGELQLRPADPEHLELVREFADEYREAIAVNEGGFENGLLYPAIPWVSDADKAKIGLAEVKSYLTLIDATPRSS